MTTALTHPNVFAHLFHKEQMAMTNSLDVAEYFGKRHKNVLQAIEKLECSAEFNRLNFQPVKYRDQKGEMRKSYRLTRDGFTFLAMDSGGSILSRQNTKMSEANINQSSLD